MKAPKGFIVLTDRQNKKRRIRVSSIHSYEPYSYEPDLTLVVHKGGGIQNDSFRAIENPDEIDMLIKRSLA